MLLEQRLADALIQRGLTLSAAESCTGGLISKRITDISGASKFYKGGACTYCNEIKHRILHVRQETLDTYTAVSRQTAEEMARGCAQAFDTDISVSATGYAEGGGEDGTPAGTIYIGMYFCGTVQVDRICIPDGREAARNGAADHAFQMILSTLENTSV